MIDMDYIVITWPESQKLMSIDNWEEHSYSIDCEQGLIDFGCSSYFVEKEWYNEVCRC